MPKVNLKDPLVKEFISTHAGEAGYAVLTSLGRGKTDEQISKKLKLKVNDVRALLNTLHYLGVIRYTKVRDRPNWYTYTWFLREERIAELLKGRYQEELKELENKLSFENTYTFFRCNNKCEKLPFELAYEYDFRCPECGSPLKEYDNSSDVRRIKRKIRMINNLLSGIGDNGFKSPASRKRGRS